MKYMKCTRLAAAASDKVYQLLAQGRWFSPGTPASSTTKTGRHDIAEILLKVALNTKIQIPTPSHAVFVLTPLTRVLIVETSDNFATLLSGIQFPIQTFTILNGKYPCVKISE
jgi:hypothetical protein